MFTVTLPALKAAEKYLEQEPRAKHIRLSVTGGGCAGLNYNVMLDADENEDDQVIEYHSITFRIDPISWQYIDGCSLQYRDGLTDAGFYFKNPNATGSCGCGKSFTI